MGRSADYCVILVLLLGEFLCSGSSRTVKKEAPGELEETKLEFTASIFTTQKDITTPLTTVPNLVPTIPTTSSSPILNPNSNPDTFSPASTLPFTTPPTTTTPTPTSTATNSPVSSSGASWCIASPTASQISLQVALDYACGYGGADCSAIQPSGSCFNPGAVRYHASYAFNSYYQKNPVPNSCNFGGSAVITSTNPSFGTCQFPSTSTSSTVLNATNSSGANVFGSVPVPMTPFPSAASATSCSFLQICVTLWLITNSIFGKDLSPEIRIRFCIFASLSKLNFFALLYRNKTGKEDTLPIHTL